jgi:two-component system LytT family response regulator
MVKLKQIKMEQQKIALSCLEGIFVFNLENLIRCETIKSYTTFYFYDSTHKTLTCSLCKVIEQIDNENFYRVHSNHLINIKFIKSIHYNSEDKIVMSDKTGIPVSRRKKKDLMEFLKTKMIYIGSIDKVK